MMASVSRAARAAAEAWSVVQVELHGRYSLERMRMFHEYSARAKWTRIICWCIFTPIPCLLVNIVLDVAPLAKPSAGRDANYVYWARGTISALVCIYAIFMHIKFLAPNLGMTHWHLSCITLVVTISCTTFDYILAGFIPMPIPFQLVTASPVFMVAFTVIFSLLFGRKLRNNVAVHSSTIRAMAVITVQLSLTFVYPIFMYGFNSIPATYQTPYMIFIPMIKIIAKNVMSKFVLSSDIKPEVLVFCIDVFNAVFNSVAMQHSTTISTSLLVMLIDISQGCISVYDVYLEVLPLKRFMARMPPGHPLCGKNILEVAMALNQKNKRKGSSRAHGLQGQQMNEIDTMIHSSTAEPPASLSLVEAFKSVRVLPLEQPSHSEFAAVTPSKISALRSKDREMFLSSTRKLLFTTEFITLIEYSEVIMPAFYSECCHSFYIARIHSTKAIL